MQEKISFGRDSFIKWSSLTYVLYKNYTNSVKYLGKKDAAPALAIVEETQISPRGQAFSS
jgi:hypothetical protein